MLTFVQKKNDTFDYGELWETWEEIRKGSLFYDEFLYFCDCFDSINGGYVILIQLPGKNGGKPFVFVRFFIYIIYMHHHHH